MKVHHLECEVCGTSYTARHPSRRHCPRRCAIGGCPRLNAAGGYCKSHRSILLGNEPPNHSAYSTKLARVLVLYREARGNRYDMCGGPFGGAETGINPVTDHDHDHCGLKHGCLGCLRGIIHSLCNTAEGKVRHGMPTVIPAGLAAYLMAPPFQSWVAQTELPPLTGRLISE